MFFLLFACFLRLAFISCFISKFICVLSLFFALSLCFFLSAFSLFFFMVLSFNFFLDSLFLLDCFFYLSFVFSSFFFCFLFCVYSFLFFILSVEKLLKLFGNIRVLSTLPVHIYDDQPTKCHNPGNARIYSLRWVLISCFGLIAREC